MNINNIIKKGFTACLLTLSLGSCSDEFLERQPLDQQTESNFYQSENDFNRALFSTYDVLQWQYIDYNFHPLFMMLDIASDDAFAGGGSSTDQVNIVDFDEHTIEVSNGAVYSLWKKYYTGINRANLILDRIDQAPLDTEVRESIEAEAKFLRAYMYLDLVRLFENVILLEEPLVNPEEYTSQTQANPDEVYTIIASDLLDAIEGLPEQTFQQRNGRATAWSARALLARAYLFYSGYYGGDLPAPSGAVTATRVRDLLDELIATSGHRLLDNYAQLFTPEGELSPESVFEIIFSNTVPGAWDSEEAMLAGELNLGIVMRGPREIPSSDPDNFPGWGFSTVSIDLVNAFDANDPRLDATVLTQEEVEMATNGFQHTGYFNEKYTTKGIREGDNQSPFYPSVGDPAINWSNNLLVIRYADVLLMAAELHAITGGNNAQNYLDQVRNRPGVNMPSVPATLENIRHERRIELAMEGHRYWDLLRYGIETANSEITVTAENQQEGAVWYTGSDTDYTINFRPETGGFLPIPQSEIDIMGGALNQNKGYSGAK